MTTGTRSSVGSPWSSATPGGYHDNTSTPTEPHEGATGGIPLPSTVTVTGSNGGVNGCDRFVRADAGSIQFVCSDHSPCCMTRFQSRFSCRTRGLSFASRIFWYTEEFMVHSVASSYPGAATQRKIITLPLPCLTMGLRSFQLQCRT